MSFNELNALPNNATSSSSMQSDAISNSASKNIAAGRSFEKIEQKDQNCLFRSITNIFSKIYHFFETLYAKWKHSAKSTPISATVQKETKLPQSAIQAALSSSQLSNTAKLPPNPPNIQINNITKNRCEKLLVEIYTTEKSYLEGICNADCVLSVLALEVGNALSFIELKNIRHHFLHAKRSTLAIVDQLEEILKLDSLEAKASAIINLYQSREFKEYGLWMSLCASDMKLLDIVCQTLETNLQQTLQFDAEFIAGFKSSYAQPMQRAMRHAMLLKEIQNLVEGDESKNAISMALEEIKNVTDYQGRLVVDTHFDISRNLLNAIQKANPPVKLTLSNNVLTTAPHIRSLFWTTPSKISKQAVRRFLSDLVNFAKAPDINKQDVIELFNILSQNPWAMNIIKISKKCSQLYSQLKKEL